MINSSLQSPFSQQRSNTSLQQWSLHTPHTVGWPLRYFSLCRICRLGRNLGQHNTLYQHNTANTRQPVNLTAICTGRIAGQHNTLGQHNTANTRQHDYSPSPKGQPLGIIAPAHGIAGFHTTGRYATGGLASTY